MLHNATDGKRPAGKTKIRWIEAVGEDSKNILGVRNWRREAMDKQW
jgi:hypothetical protein